MPTIIPVLSSVCVPDSLAVVLVPVVLGSFASAVVLSVPGEQLTVTIAG